MTKTANYDLNQWAAADRVQRTDFNSDNEKIDAALKSLSDSVGAKADASAITALNTQIAACGNCHLVTGTYTGTGTSGSSGKSSIKLSKTPLLLFIAGNNYVAMAASNSDTACSTKDSSTRAMYVTWGADGTVTWWSNANVAHQMNVSDVTYTYYALYI